MQSLATAIDVLNNLKFSAAALKESFDPGSYRKEQVRLMVKGIAAEIDFCIEIIRAAKEKADSHNLSL